MKYIQMTMVVLLLNFCEWLNAAEFCATNTTELRNALTAAADNSEHDLIKVAQGNYDTSGSSFFYQEDQGFDLEISGGWSEFFGNPCGQQFDDPYATTLDGMSTDKILFIVLFGEASLDVSNFAFINGFDPTGRGGGLYVRKTDNLNLGTTTIEHNVFINNEAQFGSAMSVSGAERFNVRNNLFSGNTAVARYVVSIVQNNAYGVYFTNNTVMFNGVTQVDEIGGVYISVSGTSNVLVANNIIQENDNLDLDVGGGGDIYLKNNNMDVVDAIAPVANVGNFNLPTRFESGILNFTPSALSPLVNAGVKPCGVCPIPVPFDNTWSIGLNDLAGNVRIQNGQADIGAYESMHNSDLIFWDRFE